MRVFICIVFYMIFLGSKAQQLPVFSSWQHNLYLINPAVTGYDMYMDFSLHGKKQWAGFDNSPFNQTLTIHSSLNESNIGLGGGFFNDNLGTIKHSGFLASVGYHLPVGDEARLGFGVTTRLSFYGLDLSKIDLYHANDPLVNANVRSGLVPDISAGFLLHREDYFVGISAQNILSSKASFNPGFQVTDIAHYNAMAGLRIEANKALGFTPAVYVSYIDGYPIFVDFRVTTHYNNRFDFDLGIKSNKDMVVGFGMEIIDYLKVHYTYDLVLSGIRSGTWGSHEILLSYDFYYNPLYKGNKKRYKWIKKGSKPKFDKKRDAF